MDYDSALQTKNKAVEKIKEDFQSLDSSLNEEAKVAQDDLMVKKDAYEQALKLCEEMGKQLAEKRETAYQAAVASIQKLDTDFAPIQAERDKKVKEEKESLIPEDLRREHAFCSVCSQAMKASRISAPGSFDPNTGIAKEGSFIARWQCPAGHEMFDSPSFALSSAV